MPPELEHIARLLNFTPLQMLALESLAEFDGETVESFCRAGILTHLQGLTGFMGGSFIEQDLGQAKKRRARELLESIKPCLKDVLDDLEKTSDKASTPQTVLPKAKKRPSKSRKSKQKPGRGWIAVNLAEWRVREIRKLAALNGMTFRIFCEVALLDAIHEYHERLGLGYKSISSLTDSELASLSSRRVEMRRLSCVCPEKN